ncbi:MAG: hypothetical protein BMS9Abin07_0424 [Acidimicrobiia bacterium]|nr:MAG: hypothetical protein BMS9Abin07_0424 [Acidimicrobiia bacterium]
MNPHDRMATTGLGIVVFVFVALGLFFGLSTIRDSPVRPNSVDGLGALADPGATYDPVRAGEPTPKGFRQLLARDRIAPIYDPTFVPASASGWPDDALVIGIEIDGEAKAYPVSHLTSREMVIDSLAGIPILVTW